MDGKAFELPFWTGWITTPLIVLGNDSTTDPISPGRAVLAQSVERIHCTNLIGMGILPLLLSAGTSPGGPSPDAAALHPC